LERPEGARKDRNDYLTQRSGRRIDQSGHGDPLLRLEEGPVRRGGRSRLRGGPLASLPRAAWGEALVRHVLDRWDDPVEGPTLAAMMRASITNDAARDRIVAQFSDQLADLFTVLGPSASVAAPLIATQILGLTMARYVWRIPAVASLPKAWVVEQVGESVQRRLDQGAG
jgi:hypothetical protein